MIGSRTRAWAVLLFVFAAGVLSGVAFERHHAWPAYSVTVGAEQEHAAALAELRDAVGLDEQQMATVHTILADNQKVVQQMWEQLRPEVQMAMQQVHAQIAELLRPEQQERFHEWLMKRRDRAQGLH